MCSLFSFIFWKDYSVALVFALSLFLSFYLYRYHNSYYLFRYFLAPPLVCTMWMCHQNAWLNDNSRRLFQLLIKRALKFSFGLVAPPLPLFLLSLGFYRTVSLFHFPAHSLTFFAVRTEYSDDAHCCHMHFRASTYVGGGTKCKLDRHKGKEEMTTNC